MFADDVQIYGSCAISEAADCIDSLNNDARRIVKWSLQNGISHPNHNQ